jgi:hypothetical protein
MVREKKAKAVDPGEEKIFYPILKSVLVLLWHSCRHQTENLIIEAALNESQSVAVEKHYLGLWGCRAEARDTLRDVCLGKFIISNGSAADPVVLRKQVSGWPVTKEGISFPHKKASARRFALVESCISGSQIVGRISKPVLASTLEDPKV